jgi:ferredoxin--NADP+ reductase
VSKWVEGRVVALKPWSERLFSIQIAAEVEPWQAGQFTKIALDIDGERVGRPYSYVNPPHRNPLEFYFITVPGGPLTAHLVELKAGDPIFVAPKAAGFLVLSELPDADHLWLLSTGTALGPFLAICETPTPWQRFKKVVLVHAVRTAAELAYQDSVRAIAAAHPDQFVYIPFVTREDTDFAIKARIPEAISDGRLEARAGIPLKADNSQVMICGNPAMVRDTTDTLIARGLKKHRRRDPGQISVENYW